MRSATIIAAAIAMATSVSAQIDGFAVFAKPATDESVPAGKPYEITWAAGKYSGPAIISLIGGETQGTQVPIKDVATIPEVGANKYTWNVDCSLGKAKVYGLKIALVNQPDIWQWSNRFHIDNSAYCPQGGSSASASASAPSAVSTSASASASGAATAYPTGTVSPSTSGSAYPTTSAGSSSAVYTSKPAVTATQSHSAPVQTMSSSTKAPASSTTGSAPIPTAAAPKVAAGSFVLAGVVAAAALAL